MAAARTPYDAQILPFPATKNTPSTSDARPSRPIPNPRPSRVTTTQKTSEITKCSICLGTFIKPKSLPCIHTFCLDCLSNCGKTAKPGSQMPCPLCRQLFIIPSGGFAAIPNNQFIEHILETEAILAITTQGREIWCELCDEDEGNNTVATGYCMECRQNLCQKCNGRHRKSQFAKTHNIVTLEDRRRSQNITKLHQSYCTTHNEEQLKLFCYDCKQTVCLMCFAIGHNGHKCSDISESTETFRKQLINDNENMSKAIISTRNELEILNSDTSKHLHQIVIAQQNIAKQCSELKAFIDAQQKQLELELNKLKETRLRQIETRRADLTSKLVTIQSFVQYSKELMEKGSMCDIARSANDLFLRSDQLLKDQTAFNKIKLYKLELEFVPTNLTDKSITLGAIQLNGKPVTAVPSSNEPSDNLRNREQNFSRDGRSTPMTANQLSLGCCPRRCQTGDAQNSQNKPMQFGQQYSYYAQGSQQEETTVCSHGYQRGNCQYGCKRERQMFCVHGYLFN